MLLGLMLGLIGLPIQAQALGFGALHLQSHLGEGLKADVPIILDASDDIQHIRIGLASPQEYRQTDLQWQPSLSLVRVSVQGKHLAQPRVELRSVRAMHSPMLSILLKFSKAGRGTYYKHFKVLLDPVAGMPSTVKHAHVANQQAYNDLDPVVLPIGQAAMVNDDSGWARLWRYGPVRKGDNLSEIARRLRKDERFTTQQVMLALYTENPHAFVGANINQLQQGIWLTVPHDDVVKKSSGDVALQAVSRLLRRHASPAEQPVSQRSKPSHYRAKVYLSADNKRIETLKNDFNDRFDGMHSEVMDAKLQMSDLNASVVSINSSVHRMQTDINHLKADMEAMKTGHGLPQIDPLRYWKVLLFALLAGLMGGWMSHLIWRKKNQSYHGIDDRAESTRAADMPDAGKSAKLDAANHDPASEPQDKFETMALESATDVATAEFTETASKQSKTLSALADEVIHLLNQAEAQLGACEFEQAEEILQRVDEKTPGSLRTAALKAQLYHETDRFDQRNDVINVVSETSDKQHWERFCTLLPSQVWDACFGSGLPE